MIQPERSQQRWLAEDWDFPPPPRAMTTTTDAATESTAPDVTSAPPPDDESAGERLSGGSIHQISADTPGIDMFGQDGGFRPTTRKSWKARSRTAPGKRRTLHSG